ncbi:MAG: thioredoxin-dependent thiol peroxidase [Arenimonas sp.]
MLKIGDKAPDFSLSSDTGHIIGSDSLKGQRYVLYFYPKDETPACTREACAFRDNLPGFGELSVPVFGVSADEEKRHAKFVHKYSLNFPLLSDPDHELIEAYGVWVEKSLYGRKYMGIARCTFVVDARGRIEQTWDKVSVDTHAADVLAYLGGEPVAATAAKPAKKANAKPAVAKKAAKKTGKKRAAAKPAKTKAAAKKAPVKKASTKKAATRKPATKGIAKKKSAARR